MPIDMCVLVFVAVTKYWRKQREEGFILTHGFQRF
jgi:hypothetical protein